MTPARTQIHKRFTLRPWFTACALAAAQSLITPAVAADSFTDALTGGKASVDIRLRYETVEQNNALQDADALTVRTRLGYRTGDFMGFSAFVEAEDVTPLMDEDYNDTLNGNTLYSVIADPDVTEINRASISYAGFAGTTLSYGRQRIILDNARFVGNVGWRQNEQTFDGLLVENSSLADTALSYAYLTNVNTITGGDVDVRVHLLNGSYSGFALGTLTGYGYFIENRSAPSTSSQTLGLRFSGKHMLSEEMKLLYTAEYAKQQDYKSGASGIDADYTFLEGGMWTPMLTVKLGYEILGNDTVSGFETPLATKHAFNGWTDQFLNTPTNGLKDVYILATGKVAGIKLLGVIHEFEEDRGGLDLGSEWGVLAAKKFGKHYNAGIKYASYSAGDVTAGKVDTDKLWLWGGLNF